MRQPKSPGRAATRYTIYGAIFGAFFPVVAFVVIAVTGRDIDLLFYIICSAPFFLGLFSRFAGIRQDSINEINRDLENRVEERTAAIQSLLDVSGQGFLYFGPDFLVRPEHSRECEDIFGGSVSGKRISELLFINETRRSEFTEGLDLFFSGKAGAEVIFELLDKETTIGDKTVEIEYRAIDSESVMCTLTDVTERRGLEAEIAEQNRRRNIILRTVSNRKYFPSFVAEARELFDVFEKIDGSRATPEELDELMRTLHTFKSNASFLGFAGAQSCSHEMEGMIADALVLEDNVDLHERSAELKERYYAELGVISETLGDEWVNNLESTTIPSGHYKKIERYIRKKYTKDEQLIRTLERYRMVRLSEVFLRYPEMAREIAQSRGKRINPLVIEGGDELVLPERFEAVSNACVHLLRNMIDHGIESPRQREVKGKSPDGTVRLQLGTAGGEYLITFSDDGGGLPLASITRKAREQGLLDEDSKLSRSKLLELIFLPGFSSSDEVTSVSGRGVGLAAVKTAVQQTGGRIMVDSKPDVGTTFRIALPIKPQ